MYKEKYKRVRFHVEFGPPSLFERVCFKMKDVTTLYMDGVRYWVTIGMGTFIKNVVIKETSGVGNCIRSGGYYDFVEKVNRKLMDEDLEINAIP